jgi:hypothetical protein
VFIAIAMESKVQYFLYKNFLISSLKLLNEQIKPYKFVFEKKDEQSARINLSILVHKNQKRIEQLSETVDYAEHLKKFYTGEVGNLTIDAVMDRYLISFLLYYLSDSKSLDFNEDMCREAYGRVEKYFYSSELPYLALAPLQNFEAEVDIVELGDRLVIKKISDKYLTELRTRAESGLSLSLSFHENIKLQYSAEMTHYLKKEEPHNIEEPIRTIRKLVSALRIFKEGVCNCPFIESRPLTWELMGGILGSHIYQYPIAFWRKKYRLQRDDISKFVAFWKRFNKFEFDKHKFLGIAINRFNYAYGRELDEDKLIDYMIALEALFLREGEKNELKYRLSMRTALFLEDDPMKRKAIRNNVQNAYDLRSRIVHGSSKIEYSEIRKSVDTIEDYLRKTIIKFLDALEKEKYETIIQKIDDSALG